MDFLTYLFRLFCLLFVAIYVYGNLRCIKDFESICHSYVEVFELPVFLFFLKVVSFLARGYLLSDLLPCLTFQLLSGFSVSFLKFL